MKPRRREAKTHLTGGDKLTLCGLPLQGVELAVSLNRANCEQCSKAYVQSRMRFQQ